MPRTFRPGDHLVIDDRSGFAHYASDTVKEWNGLRVHRSSYEARHPQDFVRSRPERQTVHDPRPRPTDVFGTEAGGKFFHVVSDSGVNAITVFSGISFEVVERFIEVTNPVTPEDL